MSKTGHRRSHSCVLSNRKSPAYELYWRFAAERQHIYFNRLEQAEAPWTDDSILQTFKFTNAYRASDRVSQYLIRHVIYSEKYPASPNEVVFRVLLFKLFNKISTWETLEAQLGLLTWQSFSFEEYDGVLRNALASGQRIYSAAYIVPPVALDRSGIKHRGHLKLIELILRGDFTARLQQTSSLKEVFELLKSYPSLGDFLAFQLAIDLNYSDAIDHDENEFVVAGPGARDGLSKTFPQASPKQAEDLIRMMTELQDQEFERFGLSYRSLWGRSLKLIDCQNIFCELSKYTRVSNPELKGVSGRTRIKQTFRSAGAMPQPWFPPKWLINEKIPQYTSQTMRHGVAR